MAIELYQIRHFAAIATTGSFTKAAIRVAVSQPALSASIAKLEEELGVLLLHRTPKGVTLSSAGRRFLSTAQEIFASCSKVKAELRAAAVERPLRIGVLRTLPTPHLVRLLGAFQQAAPQAKIELYDGSCEELQARLADHKLLATVTCGGERTEAQRSTVLIRENYALVVGIDHRFALQDSVSMEDLQGERFIVRTHCETYKATTQIFSDRKIKTHVVYKTDQDDRALALIASGFGVALMPAMQDAPGVRRIKMRDFNVERLIELRWNSDTEDEQLERLIAFIKSHNLMVKI